MGIHSCVKIDTKFVSIQLTLKGDLLCGHPCFEELEQNIWLHGPCCKGLLEIDAITKIHDRIACQKDDCNFNIFFPNRIRTFLKLQKYFAEQVGKSIPSE